MKISITLHGNYDADSAIGTTDRIRGLILILDRGEKAATVHKGRNNYNIVITADCARITDIMRELEDEGILEC